MISLILLFIVYYFNACFSCRIAEKTIIISTIPLNHQSMPLCSPPSSALILLSPWQIPTDLVLNGNLMLQTQHTNHLLLPSIHWFCGFYFSAIHFSINLMTWSFLLYHVFDFSIIEDCPLPVKESFHIFLSWFLIAKPNLESTMLVSLSVCHKSKPLKKLN